MAYRQRPRSAAARTRTHSYSSRSRGSRGSSPQPYSHTQTGGWQERFRQLKISAAPTGLRAQGYGYSHHRQSSSGSRPARPESAQGRLSRRSPSSRSSSAPRGTYGRRTHSSAPRAAVGNFMSGGTRRSSSTSRPSSGRRQRPSSAAGPPVSTIVVQQVGGVMTGNPSAKPRERAPTKAFRGAVEPQQAGSHPSTASHSSKSGHISDASHEVDGMSRRTSMSSRPSAVSNALGSPPDEGEEKKQKQEGPAAASSAAGAATKGTAWASVESAGAPAVSSSSAGSAKRPPTGTQQAPASSDARAVIGRKHTRPSSATVARPVASGQAAAAATHGSSSSASSRSARANGSASASGGAVKTRPRSAAPSGRSSVSPATRYAYGSSGRRSSTSSHGSGGTSRSRPGSASRARDQRAVYASKARAGGSRPGSAARSRSRPTSAASSRSSRPGSAARERGSDQRGFKHYNHLQEKHAAATASDATSVDLLVSDGKAGGKSRVQQIELEQRQRLQKYVMSKAYDGRSSTEFYQFGKVLGQGSFAKVRLAWHKLTGARVAIKSYEKEKLKEPSHWRRTQQEIRLMERLNHPNIIRMLETLESPKRIHIVMEHAGGGNLCQYVKARKRLGEADARAIFVQLVMALEYLHTTGIVHRDIKLENVLFDENRSMKLVDFGFSVGCRDPTKKLKIFCGTPSYMAPEIVMRRQYEGRPVDVWSLGVLLYAMMCGMFPFTAKSYPELYKTIVRAHLRLPDFMSHAVKDLLRRMLHPDAKKRVTVAQIRRHCWCSTPIQALTRQLKAPAEHSLLVSEPIDHDMYLAVIAKCAELGFNAELVTKSVFGRARNHFSVTYYLLLFLYGRQKAAKKTQALYMAHPPRQGDVIYCGPYAAALRRKLLFDDSIPDITEAPEQVETKPARPSSAAMSRDNENGPASRPPRPQSAAAGVRQGGPQVKAAAAAAAPAGAATAAAEGEPKTDKNGNLLDMMRYKPNADGTAASADEGSAAAGEEKS